MMNGTRALRFLAIFGILVSAATTRSLAITVDFDSNADYDGYFVETAQPAAVSLDASGYLLKAAGMGGATAFFYNEGATGGSGGSGGVNLVNPRDVFGATSAFTIQADFKLTTFSGLQNSVGFYVSVPNALDAGYVVIFRLDDTDGEGGASDVRFYDSDSKVSAAAVGTLRSTQYVSLTPLDLNIWYTAKLKVEHVGADVVFTASLFHRGGKQVGENLTWTDETDAIKGGGQVGVRLSTNGRADLQFDNFAVVP